MISTSSKIDFYRMLQVDPEAEPEVIDAAYHRLSRKYHPDLNADPDAAQRMRDINAAHEVLGDAQTRRLYDACRQAKQATRAAAVPNPPLLLVNTQGITLQGTASAPRPAARFDISNRGGGLLTGKCRSSATWLRVSPASFSANRLAIEIRADTADLAIDCLYEATVTIDSNGGVSQVPVRLRLSSLVGPRLEVTPARLDLGSTLHGIRDRATITIANLGGQPLTGQISPDQPWLNVDSANFEGEGVTIGVSVNLSLLPPAPDQHGTLRIRSNAGAFDLPVRVFLADGAPRLSITPGALDFGPLHERDVRTLGLRLANLGRGLLSGQAVARGDWLSIQPSSFVASLVDLSISANPETLHGFWQSSGPVDYPVESVVVIQTNGGTIEVPIRATLRRSGRIKRLFDPLRFAAESLRS